MYSEFSRFYDQIMEHLEYDKWIEIFEKEFDNKTKKVLDLGCGTGELSYRLSEKGYDVAGVDYSNEMLSIAELKLSKKNIKIPLVCGDMRDFDLGEKFDAVISIFDTVNHLLTLEDFEKTLKNVNKHLKKDGLFIFDIATRELMDEMFRDGIFADDRDGLTILWQHWIDEETDLDNIVISFFLEIEENLYKRSDEHYEKKIFEQELIDEIINKNNFKLIKKIKTEEIAGKRILYVIKKK